MIAFSPLRTRRLDVRFKELSIGDEIALCHLPEGAHEKSLTEFLERVIDTASAPSARHITDPRAWSVGERIFALSHYCMHVREAADYAVTQSSTLSDYLDATKDVPEQLATFEVLEDSWVLHPLTGAALEALETLQADSALRGREHWIIGAMAAQLLRADENPAPPDAIADHVRYIKWLSDRIARLCSLSSTDFDALFLQYRIALAKDTQYFSVWFDEQGVVVMPKEAGAATPPARFLVSSCLGHLALTFTGKT